MPKHLRSVVGGGDDLTRKLGNPALLLRLPENVGEKLAKDAKKAKTTAQAVVRGILADHYGIDVVAAQRGRPKKTANKKRTTRQQVMSAAEEKIEWFPIAESLPADSRDVLVFVPEQHSDDRGRVNIACLYGKRWVYADGEDVESDIEGVPGEVTHWSELPCGPV